MRGGGISAGGISAGGETVGGDPSRVAAPAPAPDDAAAATLRGRGLSPERIAGLSAENARLLVDVERVREQLARFAPPPADPTAFRFGLPAETPTFDRADWTALAGHALALTALMGETQVEVTAGREPSADLVARIRAHNTPLAHFTLAVAAEVGASQPNAAWTQPSVLSSLVRAALLLREAPLSRDQEVAIRTLSDRWISDEERIRARLPPDAPALRRTVEEVDARLRFVEAVKGVLSDHQRSLLFPPESAGRVGLDLFSPGMVYGLRPPVAATSREALGPRLVEALFGLAGLEGEDLTPYLWVGRQWVADLHLPDPSDPPRPRQPYDRDLVFPPVETVQAEARAAAAAIEQILALGLLPPAWADLLRQVPWPLSPRLSPPPPPAAAGPGDGSPR